MKDYQKMHEDKLNALKESVLDSAIKDQLELKAISNKKLEAMTDSMSRITGKRVWEDFSFRTGKIFGILRFIVQNPLHRQDLLAATGLNNDYIDIYMKVCGNAPYVNTTNNTLNPGKPMNVEATKEFIKIVAIELGLVVDDDDLSDITQERWDRIYQSALERAIDTIKFNEQNNPDVQGNPTVYDE